MVHADCQETSRIEPSVLGEEWVHCLPAKVAVVSDDEDDGSDPKKKG
jgi:hypothetical protein